MIDSMMNSLGLGDSSAWSIISNKVKVTRHTEINTDAVRMAKLADRQLNTTLAKRIGDKFLKRMNEFLSSS